MLSEDAALLLCFGIVVTALAGLYTKKVSTALIMLFYSSIVLGVTFTLYGDALIGLLHMITFAGAISVLLLTVVLMTGQSNLGMGVGRAAAAGAGVATAAVAGASYLVFSSASGSPRILSQDISLQLLAFIWEFRPWDVLILVVLFASSMLVVVNLFSREERS